MENQYGIEQFLAHFNVTVYYMPQLNEVVRKDRAIGVASCVSIAALANLFHCIYTVPSIPSTCAGNGAFGFKVRCTQLCL